MRRIIEDKRGQEFMPIIYIFLAIFVVIVLGLIIIIINPIIQDSSDAILPALKESVGTIPLVNISQTTNPVVDTGETIIHSFDWLFGVLYFLAVLTIFGLAIASNLSQSKLLMGLWIVLSVFLIVFAIIISNIVEDLANQGGEYGAGISSQSLLYFLLLNSPYVFIIVTFISGIIVFVGLGNQEEIF